jgi:hypothetical protein
VVWCSLLVAQDVLHWEDMQEVVWWGTIALLVPFIGPGGGQERGLEGMRPTAMVDLHCIDFGVEGEPGAEMAEGRGGEERRQGLRFLRGGERARLGRG